MQEDEFEKRIRQELDEFALPPSDTVWQKVEAEITLEKKKRKHFVYLIFASCLLLIALVGIFYSNSFNSSHPKITEISATTKRVDTSNNMSLPSTTIKKGKKPTRAKGGKSDANNIIRNNNSIKSGKIIASAESKDIGEKDKTTTPAELLNKRKASLLISKQRLQDTFTNEEKDFQNSNSEPKKLTSKKRDEEEESKILSTEVEKTPFINKQIDTAAIDKNLLAPLNSLVKDSLAKDSLVKIPLAKLSAKAAAKEAIKVPRQRKVSYGFSVYVGASDNFSGISLTKPTYADASYSSVGSTANTGNIRQTLNRLDHKRSLSYEIGFFLKKPLSRRLSFSTALNYHYYSTTTRVGNKLSTQTRFYDSVLNKRLSINELYLSGSQNSYKNKYHFIEVPLDLQIRINKNSNKPFILSTGISLGYLIGSNALYANNKEKVFYVEKDQFQRLQLSGQAGVQMPVIGGKAYILTIGPALQYGFNSLTKPVIGTNQHLFTIGLKGYLQLK